MHAVSKIQISHSPIFSCTCARPPRRAVRTASGKIERSSQARFGGLTLVSRAPWLLVTGAPGSFSWPKTLWTTSVACLMSPTSRTGQAAASRRHSHRNRRGAAGARRWATPRTHGCYMTGKTETASGESDPTLKPHHILSPLAIVCYMYSSTYGLSMHYWRKITYTCMHACARALHDAELRFSADASSLLQLVWVQKLGWGRRFRGWYCCRKFSQNIVMVGGTSID